MIKIPNFKTFISAVSICILLLSCKADNCEVDADFLEKFNANLVVLENFTVDIGSAELDEVLSAVGYINAVTEIKSQIYLGDIVFYEPEFFEEDLKKWEQWYESNKCTITLMKADSLHQKNLFNRPDIG